MWKSSTLPELPDLWSTDLARDPDLWGVRAQLWTYDPSHSVWIRLLEGSYILPWSQPYIHVATSLSLVT